MVTGGLDSEIFISIETVILKVFYTLLADHYLFFFSDRLIFINSKSRTPALARKLAAINHFRPLL